MKYGLGIEFYPELYLETLAIYSKFPLIGCGSYKLCFDLGDKVVVIPYTECGQSEINNAYNHYCQYKDSRYGKHLAEIIDISEYYMVLEKLEIVHDNDTRYLMDFYEDTDIVTNESFGRHNVGIDSRGVMKSFDYGYSLLNDELSDYDFLSERNDEYYNSVFKSDRSIQLKEFRNICKSIIEEYNLKVTYRKVRDKDGAYNSLCDNRNDYEIYLGDLKAGDLNMTIEGECVYINSIDIFVHLQRLGITKMLVAELLKDYTIMGDATYQAYEAWKRIGAEFDDYKCEDDLEETCYSFIIN